MGGYGARIDTASAREKLAARVEAAAERAPAPPAKAPRPKAKHKEAGKAGGAQDTLVDFLTSRQGKALQREVVRGVFGLLLKRL